MAPLFFRKSVGAFLVYDCGKMDTFNAIDTWFEQISNNADSRVIVMLLGNKCDISEREVPYNMAMEYARKRNFGFLEVSAKTGTNIKSAFTCLLRGNFKLINIFQKYIETKVCKKILHKETKAKASV